MPEKTLKQTIVAFNFGVIQDCVTMYKLVTKNGYTMDDVVDYIEGLKTAYTMRVAVNDKELRRELKATNPEAYKSVMEERKRRWKESITVSKQPNGTWKPCCKDKGKVLPYGSDMSPVFPPPLPTNMRPPPNKLENQDEVK